MVGTMRRDSPMARTTGVGARPERRFNPDLAERQFFSHCSMQPPGKDEGTLAEVRIKIRSTEAVGGSVFHGMVDLGKDTHETKDIRATGGCALRNSMALV
jgi:hypothetical protein